MQSCSIPCNDRSLHILRFPSKDLVIGRGIPAGGRVRGIPAGALPRQYDPRPPPGSQQRLRSEFEPQRMPPFQENALSNLSLESFNYLHPEYKLHKHLRAVLSKGLRPPGRAAAEALGKRLMLLPCPSPLHTQLHFSTHTHTLVCKKMFLQEGNVQLKYHHHTHTHTKKKTRGSLQTVN